MLPRPTAIDPSTTSSHKAHPAYAVFQQKSNRMEGNQYKQWYNFPTGVEVDASIISKPHSSALPAMASPQMW